MCVVIDTKVIISNVFYAYYPRNVKNSTLEYKVVEQYKKILYKEITEKCGYVLFSVDDSNFFDIDNHYFVKENGGILCLNSLEDSFIEEVNSIYSEEIQDIIKITRDKIKKCNMVLKG